MSPTGTSWSELSQTQATSREESSSAAPPSSPPAPPSERTPQRSPSAMRAKPKSCANGIHPAPQRRVTPSAGGVRRHSACASPWGPVAAPTQLRESATGSSSLRHHSASPPTSSASVTMQAS